MTRTARTTTSCSWCAGSMADADPATLCRTHQAEHAGVSEAELDRWDADELLDQL